jgi:hypothetical protein
VIGIGARELTVVGKHIIVSECNLLDEIITLSDKTFIPEE